MEHCINDFYQILNINSDITRNQMVIQYAAIIMNDQQAYAYNSLLAYYDLLEELKIQDQALENEINRIANIVCIDAYQNFLKNEFLNDLKNTHKEIREQIKFETNIYRYQPYALQPAHSYLQTAAPQMRNELVNTLHHLTFKPKRRDQDIQHLTNLYGTCEQKCDENPKWQNFFGAVGKLVMSAFGFMTGVILGATTTAPAILCASTSLLTGIVSTTFATGSDVKEAGSFKRAASRFVQHLTFQTPIYSNAKSAAHVGLKFFDSYERKKPRLSEKPSPALYSHVIL